MKVLEISSFNEVNRMARRVHFDCRDIGLDIPTALNGEYLTPKELDDLATALSTAKSSITRQAIFKAALGEPAPKWSAWIKHSEAEATTKKRMRKVVLQQLEYIRARNRGVGYTEFKWYRRRRDDGYGTTIHDAVDLTATAYRLADAVACRVAAAPNYNSPFEPAMVDYLVKNITQDDVHEVLDANPVWNLAVDHLWQALEVTRRAFKGRRRQVEAAGDIVAEALFTMYRARSTQLANYKFARGIHYGEYLEDLIPPYSVIRKGPKAVRRYMKVARLLDPAVVRGGGYASFGRVRLSDVQRLGHLSPLWIRTAYYLCATEDTGTGSRVAQIDWALLSRLMMKQATREDFDRLYNKVGRYRRGGLMYLFRYHVWRAAFGRVPKDQSVFWGCFRDPRNIPMLKPVWKHFKWLLDQIEGGEYCEREHVVLSAANLAATFRGQVRQLISEREGPRWRVIHDLGVDLRPPYSKDITSFIWRHRNNDYVGAVRVANSWEALIPLGASVQMPLRELQALVSSFRYRYVRKIELATECARWGISQYSFEEIQDRWLKGLEKLTHESIPWVSIISGEYRFYRLAKDDPRGIFLGMYTNCCQHPGGAGSSCAWHGHESPDGAFYVIEYRGHIIAQSWAWRNKHVLVFDNIEVLGRDETREKVVKKLYIEAAQELLGRLGIKEVRAGVGYSGVSLGEYMPVEDPAEAPRGVYTDARQQVVLAVKEVSR